MRPGSIVAIVLLFLVALAHLLRMLLGLHVTVETTEIPMWVSLGGAVIPAGVAVALWREGRQSGTDA